MKTIAFTRRSLGLMRWLGVVSTIALSVSDRAVAQVVPDASLGAERSVVAPNTVIRGVPSDRIDGGALRGINLFHSFEQFNVGAGRGVYFANPAGVENILSRVTGNNRSEILGRLGVLGNANLFLLNPNGIVFGANASLDVAGSFTASTANAIALGTQGFFSATQPENSTLLAIAPGALFFDQQLRQPRTIQNSGNLTAGRDLTLSADNLELQGQVRSGGNLTLQAQDTLRIRDSVTAPFIAAAGGKLLVQGDRSVDIFALNHPDSGLFSGGDMVLRSTNTVGGDAHYHSGGNFRIEQLDGQLGGLFSPHDPVVRASGDVAAANYIGASLHIFAGGSVTIPGFIWIQGADTVNGLVDSIQLSDNTSISINGRIQPTLDIRAGTTAVGTPSTDTGTPSSANITLGTIFFADSTLTTQIAGKILLTNQYQPNAALNGNIQVSDTFGGIFSGQAIVNGGFEGGGSTAIDSRGSITLNGGIRSNTVLSPSGVPLGNGGDVTLLARQSITLAAGSVINSSGLLGGTLTLKSGGSISSTSGGIASFSFSPTPGLKGGDINLNARSLSLTNSLLANSTYGRATAGDINLNVSGAVTLTGINGMVAGIQSNVEPGAVASGGTVNITTGSLALNGAQIQTLVRGPSFAADGTILRPAGQGEAGTINLNVDGAITLGGINGPFTSLISSVLDFGAKGKGGNIIILTAGSLSFADGARLLSSTFGQGDAGNVTVNVRGEAILSGVVVTPVQVSSSGIQSNVEAGAVGNGGNIEIHTGSLSLTNGAQIQTIVRRPVFASDGTVLVSAGQGEAGNVQINARNAVLLDGTGIALSNSTTTILPSLIASALDLGATGKAGNITVKADSLSILNGARLTSSTGGQGDAGNIKVEAQRPFIISGVENGFLSGAYSTVDYGAIGNGGDIEVNAGSLSLTNGGQIQTIVGQPFRFNGAVIFPAGRGRAGSVKIDVRDHVVLDGTSPAIRQLDGTLANFPSQIASALDLGASGKAGNITLKADSLSISNGARLSSSTFGQGDAGNIRIEVQRPITITGVENGFFSGAYSTVEFGAIGNGGTIEVNAGSLSLTNGAQIQTIVRQPFQLNGVVLLPAGRGNAGDVNIDVRDTVTLDGTSPAIRQLDGTFLSSSSQIASALDLGATGAAGDITLKAGSLSLSNGARLTSGTFGQGNAGNVLVTVREAVTFDGVGSNGTSSGIESQVQPTAIGRGGNVTLSAGLLSVTNGAQLNASTGGQGDAGNIVVNVRDEAMFDGVGSTGFSSGIGSQVALTGVGKGGSLTLSAGSLTLRNGAQLSSGTFGRGDAGDVVLTVREAATFDGVGRNGVPSNAGSQVADTGVGKGGNVTLSAGSLLVSNGAQLNSGTFGQGNAGDVALTIRGAAVFDGAGSTGVPSNAGSQVAGTGIGKGGNLTLSASSLTLTNGAVLSSSTFGQGDAGEIVLRVSDQLKLVDGGITTFSFLTSGGGIDITARAIRLSGNSNILTNVLSGVGNGGDITLTATSIIALNDSNILASARDGKGGNITFKTRAFFGQNYRPAPPGTDLSTLFSNGRVDVNASGTVSGIITLPDVSFLQNSLTDFSQALTDTTQLLANSCIVRSRKQNGKFFITGSGGLPVRPGDAPLSPYPTGQVGGGRDEGRGMRHEGKEETYVIQNPPPGMQTLPDRPWKIGDPIVEPQGVYRLANGDLVMSRECKP